ncbi:Leucyl-tRNA synthetase, Domain 2 [Pseudomonas cuatrocienegasensis]|uniref:Leucyl-tRNA synthetase, Domain 2 n=1 Tax=Pseudomonas cuatrocienegasensis TaxID=543360 RepID=A0ABY1BR66_9PSED|nr:MULTISPECIES: class I tRNA ligase family protein [Pseudomonas]OEC32957.1 hypothetical protein A7D25_21445 [Pseudomonas sp. 21C1]SER42963.1 Leucyl-tRNA synthetase, Domain 2 [Pseudomonas cuatrocienegasensis]
MKTFALLEHTHGSEPADLTLKRASLFAAFMSRATQCVPVNADAVAVAAQLNRLLEKGHVHFNALDGGAFEAFYGPSCEATAQISTRIPFWSEKIVAKIRKSVRQSQGAICSLQLFDAENSIDVFVTDWSSCTAACAIAVHKYHWFTRNLADRPDADNYFTGAYVRNPLTGDLMSVWVADWVKPDFGTGAVLVNPAHNRTDLDFARRVGLPIRFALSIEAQADEHAMPVPPVLKTGHAVRAGFLDGKPAPQVHNETVNVLLRKGSARTHEDKRIPGEAIARIEPTTPEQAQLYWNPHLGTFHEHAVQGLPVRVEFSASFKAAVTTVTHRPDHLQVDASIQKKNIGVLAALIFDLGGLEAFVPLTLLESVEYSGSRADGDQAVDLALLVGEEPEKVLVIRKALIDQIDSFLSGCQKLSARLGENGTLPPDQVNTLLEHGDAVSAFRSLYQWQRQMVANDEVIDQCVYTSVLTKLGVRSA